MAPSQPPRVSVLLIEDNMDVADSLARFLRIGAGFDVRVAYDGPSGLKAAIAQPPDAIVCDIALPKVSGLDLATELVAHLPAKPVLIAVTAFSGEYPEAKARAAGFDYYLTKPADPFVIERLIQARDLGPQSQPPNLLQPNPGPR
jgi:DNA-binding response OmpR family regulator